MDAIERALEDISDWIYFERLCCRVLNSEGYKVDPRGGSGDAGRDAIEGDEVTFQFSLREDTTAKLGEELDRYKKGKKAPKEYVYATNREVSARIKDEQTKRFAEVGMGLVVCDRAWLSAKLGADKVAHLRSELLAQRLIHTPDIIRIALSTPLRTAMLGMLEAAGKDSLTDERLRRVRALMGKDPAEAERLLRGVLAQGALPKDQEFEAHNPPRKRPLRGRQDRRGEGCLGTGDGTGCREPDAGGKPGDSPADLRPRKRGSSRCGRERNERRSAICSPDERQGAARMGGRAQDGSPGAL